MQNSLPTFLIVGAARSGTTSIYHWLSQHPDIYMSPVKETNYFTRDLIGREGPGDREFIPFIDRAIIKSLIEKKNSIFFDYLLY